MSICDIHTYELVSVYGVVCALWCMCMLFAMSFIAGTDDVRNTHFESQNMNATAINRAQDEERLILLHVHFRILILTR